MIKLYRVPLAFACFSMLYLCNSYAAVSNTKEQFRESIVDGSFFLKSNKALIILKSDCMVNSKEYGEGKWVWSNGGYQIFFNKPKLTLTFGRQEVPIENKCGDI